MYCALLSGSCEAGTGGGGGGFAPGGDIRGTSTAQYVQQLSGEPAAAQGPDGSVSSVLYVANLVSAIDGQPTDPAKPRARVRSWRGGTESTNVAGTTLLFEETVSLSRSRKYDIEVTIRSDSDTKLRLLHFSRIVTRAATNGSPAVMRTPTNWTDSDDNTQAVAGTIRVVVEETSAGSGVWRFRVYYDSTIVTRCGIVVDGNY